MQYSLIPTKRGTVYGFSAMPNNLDFIVWQFKQISVLSEAWKQELEIAQSHDITKSNFGFEEW